MTKEIKTQEEFDTLVKEEITKEFCNKWKYKVNKGDFIDDLMD